MRQPIASFAPESPKRGSPHWHLCTHGSLPPISRFPPLPFHWIGSKRSIQRQCVIKSSRTIIKIRTEGITCARKLKTKKKKRPCRPKLTEERNPIVTSPCSKEMMPRNVQLATLVHTIKGARRLGGAREKSRHYGFDICICATNADMAPLPRRLEGTLRRGATPFLEFVKKKRG